MTEESLPASSEEVPSEEDLEKALVQELFAGAEEQLAEWAVNGIIEFLVNGSASINWAGEQREAYLNGRVILVTNDNVNQYTYSRVGDVWGGDVIWIPEQEMPVSFGPSSFDLFFKEKSSDGENSVILRGVSKLYRIDPEDYAGIKGAIWYGTSAFMYSSLDELLFSGSDLSNMLENISDVEEVNLGEVDGSETTVAESTLIGGSIVSQKYKIGYDVVCQGCDIESVHKLAEAIIGSEFSGQILCNVTFHFDETDSLTGYSVDFPCGKYGEEVPVGPDVSPVVLQIDVGYRRPAIDPEFGSNENTFSSEYSDYEIVENEPLDLFGLSGEQEAAKWLVTHTLELNWETYADKTFSYNGVDYSYDIFEENLKRYPDLLKYDFLVAAFGEDVVSEWF